MSICQITNLYKYKMLLNVFNLFTFKIIPMLYYFASQRKLHVYENLASSMMPQASPTSASVFWFYYNGHQDSMDLQNFHSTKFTKLSCRSLWTNVNHLVWCKTGPIFGGRDKADSLTGFERNSICLSNSWAFNNNSESALFFPT